MAAGRPGLEHPGQKNSRRRGTTPRTGASRERRQDARDWLIQGRSRRRNERRQDWIIRGMGAKDQRGRRRRLKKRQGNIIGQVVPGGRSSEQKRRDSHKKRTGLDWSVQRETRRSWARGLARKKNPGRTGSSKRNHPSQDWIIQGNGPGSEGGTSANRLRTARKKRGSRFG